MSGILLDTKNRKMKTLLSLHLRVLSRGTGRHVISSSPWKVKCCQVLGKHSKKWKPDTRFLESSLKYVGFGAQRKELDASCVGSFPSRASSPPVAFVNALVYVFISLLVIVVFGINQLAQILFFYFIYLCFFHRKLKSHPWSQVLFNEKFISGGLEPF